MNSKQGSRGKWRWVVAIVLLIGIVYSSLPLPAASSSNCEPVEGKVVKVENGSGASDVVIVLANDNAYYYINRGLDRGVKLDALAKQLVDKTVTVYYIKHWSILNFSGKTRHVARIVVNDEVAYNEWKENQ